MSKIIAINLLVIYLMFAAFFSHASSVTFEAESGVLGSQWAVSNSSSLAYTTIISTSSGSNPVDTNYVATYTVTFPAAGTYQLYARVLVGPNGYNSDSLFYGNGLGTQDAANSVDWVLVNGLAGVGFSNTTDVVTGGGMLGTGMWKWINLSQFTGQTGFAVSAGNLTQTLQIGGREAGLEIDKFVFGTINYNFTVSNLDNATDGMPPPPPVSYITWSNTQQHIDGFGFSSAWCGQLSAAKNNALYNTLGMSLLRIRIEEHTNWTQEIANSAAAHAYGAKVLGCAWRAPASMVYYVTNVTATSTNIFTYMSNTNFGVYAAYLNQAANAHNLDYVSVKNEPDLYDSSDLNLTADQIRIFCESNASAIGRPVAIADAVGFTDSFTDPTINDPLAISNVTIVSGHFYGGGNILHTNALAHGKAVWMTEHYLDGGTTNFPVCLNFAKEISDAMNNQFSAYVAWWAQDGDTNINLANSSGTILKDGYTMGQFSKFIRPGFYRIGTANTIGAAAITAYKDIASSNYVIVAINPGSTVITQQFNLFGFPATSSVTPWITSYTQSLAAQLPITSVGSSFTYSIQPSNIVTFVGTVLPMIPVNLTAAAGNNQVSLNWSAVTGASSYNIRRATVSGGPYSTTLTNVTGTGFIDTSIITGTTYYYVVSAVNVSGESAGSAEAGATTVPFYTLSPLADSYVESGNPAVNYGSSTNLLVKNNVTISTRNTYLLFDVHMLTNVRTATLTLMPNRVDDTTVKIYYGLAFTNWTEPGINWNNQPGGAGVFFATNTVVAGVPVVLDVTGPAAGAATNGGLLSIEVTQPTNSLNGLIQFCSREHPVNSWRPVLTYAFAANTPPVLATISNQAIGAGMVLNITNVAADNDVPVQTLTFSLLSSPANAIMDTNSGVLTWRPLVTQAATTNPFTVMVADNGAPGLSATQTFVVTVTNFTPPVISIPASSAGQLVLKVNGDNGPDYQIQSSTNLINWTAVLTTNAPAMPFVWTNNTVGLPVNFFRIIAGPPWP